MKVSYATDVGIVREDNQDSVLAHVFDDSSGIFVVADGMGGYEGGEFASSKAVKILFDAFKSESISSMDGKEITERLRLAVKKANTEVINDASTSEKLYGMGTTVVACIIASGKLYTANVGDSRCYICNKDSITQITTDHSLVYDLISRGLITREEAKEHPRRNVITRAIGSEENVDVDIFISDLHINDVVLLCSDGLYNMVSDEEIKNTLRRFGTNVSKRLIKSANENGGIDNISAVAVKISNEVK